jgi:hypothetical protein
MLLLWFVGVTWRHGEIRWESLIAAMRFGGIQHAESDTEAHVSSGVVGRLPTVNKFMIYQNLANPNWNKGPTSQSN